VDMLRQQYELAVAEAARLRQALESEKLKSDHATVGAVCIARCGKTMYAITL